MNVTVIKNGKDATTGKQSYAVEVEVRKGVRVNIHGNLMKRAANAVKRNTERLINEITRNNIQS